VKLVRAHALLGGAKKEHGLKPHVQGDLGSLKDRSHGHGELLPAILALPEAGARRLALKLVVAPYDAAVRAYGAVGPLKALKVLAGLIGVLKVGLVEAAVSGHDCLLVQPWSQSGLGLSSI
jgi:hypothetical protein